MVLRSVELNARAFAEHNIDMPMDEIKRALYRAIDKGVAPTETHRHRTIGAGRPDMKPGETVSEDPMMRADRALDRLRARRQDYEDG